MHDTQHHISFAKNIRDIQVTWVGASVDDTVHIKIQMIKFGQECRVGYNLINLRVTFTDPSVELKKKIENGNGQIRYNALYPSIFSRQEGRYWQAALGSPPQRTTWNQDDDNWPPIAHLWNPHGGETCDRVML